MLGNKQVEEYLDIRVPEVVKIEPEAKAAMTEYVDESEIINPFQTASTPNITQTSFDKESYANAIDNSQELTPIVAKTTEVLPENPVVPASTVTETVPVSYEEPVIPSEEEYLDKDSLLEEDGSVNLPNVINKVRDFISSLDEVSNLITTTELDLTDSYQIIIEIDKNSN